MTATATAPTKLTANETAILKAFPSFQYASDYSLADMVSSWSRGRQVWTWSFTDDAAAAAGITVRAVKGVISSLVKKGLVTCENDGPADERTITVTDAGIEQVVALQDPEPEPEPEPVVAEPECPVCAVGGECGRHHPNHNETEPAVADPTPEPETPPEQPEAPVSEAFPVVWPESVAKLFFRALAKDGADILASAYGLTRQSNQTKLALTITGDPDRAAWLADQLPTLFVDANESLKLWRKTSPNYKRHNLGTTDGRRDAYASEQDYLRDFCRAVAGTFTNDMLASDGVQAGLAYVNGEAQA